MLHVNINDIDRGIVCTKNNLIIMSKKRIERKQLRKIKQGRKVQPFKPLPILEIALLTEMMKQYVGLLDFKLAGVMNNRIKLLESKSYRTKKSN